MPTPDDVKKKFENALDSLQVKKPPIDNGGEPPNYDGMQERLTKLETRIETVLPTLATKADIAEAKSDIFKWGSTFGIALTAIIVAVLSFMISRLQPAPALPNSSAGAPVANTQTPQINTKQFDPATAKPIEEAPSAKKP